MTALPRHLLPDTATVGFDGALTIGGVSLLDIAEEFGTPAYVFDEAHLEARCREAVAAFPDGVAYATKAFLCLAMARMAHVAGMRLDVASGGEMHVALAADVPASQLVFHGNNKSAAELSTAIEKGVGLIVVDSFDEIDRIETIWHAFGDKPPVHCLIRVTPGVEAHTHEYVMTGQDDSKFGFGLASGHAQAAVDRIVASPTFELQGIHAHIGSQIFDTVGFEKEIEVLTPFVRDNNIKELCIGGGLGVAYVGEESALTIAEWGVAVRKAMAASGLPESVRVTAEPGRSIVATAGITLYTVGTIKELPGIRTYLSVDGGMSDNPRPVLYGSGYEAFLPRDPEAQRPRTVTIVGKHCESGDLVVRDAKIPESTVVNDIIATPVTGAYGHTMASNYNRVGRPPVIFVRDGDARVVVRRETYEDLIRLEV